MSLHTINGRALSSNARMALKNSSPPQPLASALNSQPSTSFACVLPFSHVDAGAALELLRWMTELRGSQSHRALLVTDDDSIARKPDVAAQIQAEAKRAFGEVSMTVLTGIGHLKWPAASTMIFIHAARHIARHIHAPFFFCEADCIPIHRHWLAELEQNYRKCRTPFMGCIVELNSKPNKHVTGCACYPPNAIEWVEEFEARARRGEWLAWDLAAAERMVPLTSNTDLVQHSWGLWKEPPTFVRERQWFEPNYIKTLNSLSPSAAVFHRCKDGSLIRLLRERKQNANAD